MNPPFYPTVDHLARRFDEVGRQLGFSAESREAHVGWQILLRGELSRLLGLEAMQPCDPEPQVVEREVLDGYVREKVLLQTEPGVLMPCYLLIPAELAPGERRPVIIAPHGHASAGKYAVAGREDLPAVRETIETYNYAYGVQLVRQGFVVCCPDARGFGERREPQQQGEENMLHGSCTILLQMGLPLGQTVAGMWTWDLMRLADYLATRPECAAERLGCAGLSGGGLQTLWFAALDERVKCAVISGYFYGVRESLLEISCCACNYVPHAWELADMGDLGALIAPRPLLIETGDEDTLNGRSNLQNVLPQVAITRGAYALYQAEDRLAHDIFHGPHRWNGVNALPWLKKHLG